MKKKESKQQLIAELVGDAYRELHSTASCTVPDTKVSVLAAALDVFSRGSKYRQDAIEIIKGCFPKYFTDPEDSETRVDDNYFYNVERYLPEEDLWAGCTHFPTREKANDWIQNEQQKHPNNIYRVQKWHIG